MYFTLIPQIRKLIAVIQYLFDQKSLQILSCSSSRIKFPNFKISKSDTYVDKKILTISSEDAK